MDLPLRIAAPRTSWHIGRRLIARTLGDQSMRHVMMLAGGTVLGQAITVLATPVLTRLYDPRAFGILAIFVSLYAIPSVIGALAYDMAIPLPAEAKPASALLLLCVSLVVVTTALFAIGAAACPLHWFAWTGSDRIAQYRWLLPLGFGGVALYRVGAFWAVRRQKFRILAGTKVRQAVAANAVQLACGAAGISPLGLLLGDTVGRASGSSKLLLSAWNDVKGEIRHLRPKDLAGALVKYRRFPLFSGAASTINSTGFNLPPLLLAAISTPAVVGAFALARNITALPAAIVSEAATQGYTAELSAALRAGEPVTPVCHRYLWRLSGAAALAVVCVALGAVLGFDLIFGHRWASAKRLVLILAPVTGLTLVGSPISSTLPLLERQHTALGIEVCRQVLVVLSVSFVGLFHLGSEAAIAAYSGSVCLGYALLVMMTLSHAKSYDFARACALSADYSLT